MKKLLFLLAVITLAWQGTKAQDGAFEKTSKYNFQQTVETLKEEAVAAGWAIPAEHNMQAILKKKNKEVLPATILVLCNANFAYELLKNDDTRKVQSMLPCRVAVYEKEDGKTYVAWSNYAKAGKEVTEEAIEVFTEIAEEIKEITTTVTD
ncbi:DUF302 domain-containing protein [Marinilabilia sp.]|uniref:DUF302 domain-containing protein n=1 Tax=Marinilabilia sp. TaxID=2021252 RepID=UPI0025B948B6|nr:DUF302 domain-containing protein [Marinilabilia sp.]